MGNPRSAGNEEKAVQPIAIRADDLKGLNYLQRKILTAYAQGDFDSFLTYCIMLVDLANQRDQSQYIWQLQIKDKRLGDLLLNLYIHLAQQMTGLQRQLNEHRQQIARCEEKIVELKEAKGDKEKIRLERKQTQKLKQQSERILKKLNSQYGFSRRSTQSCLRLLYEIDQRTQRDLPAVSAQDAWLFKATQPKWYHWFVKKWLQWFGTVPKLPQEEYKLKPEDRQRILGTFTSPSEKVELASLDKNGLAYTAGVRDQLNSPPLNAQAAYMFQTQKVIIPPKPIKAALNEAKDEGPPLPIVQVYQARTVTEQKEKSTELKTVITQEKLAPRISAQIGLLKVDESPMISSYQETRSKFNEWISKRMGFRRIIHDFSFEELLRLTESAQHSLVVGQVCLKIPGKGEVDFSGEASFKISFSQNALEAFLENKKGLMTWGLSWCNQISFDPVSGKFVSQPGTFCELDVDRSGNTPTAILKVKYNSELEEIEASQLTHGRSYAYSDSKKIMLSDQDAKFLSDQGCTQESAVKKLISLCAKKNIILSKEQHAFIAEPFIPFDFKEDHSFYGVLALILQQTHPEKFSHLLNILINLKSKSPDAEFFVRFCKAIFCQHEWHNFSKEEKREEEKTEAKKSYYDLSLIQLDLALLGYLEKLATLSIPEQNWLKELLFREDDFYDNRNALTDIFRGIDLLKNLAEKIGFELPPGKYMPHAYTGIADSSQVISLTGYINCLTFAKAPHALVRIPWKDWPDTDDYAIYMLRAGYMVLHKDMMLGWDRHQRLQDKIYIFGLGMTGLNYNSQKRAPVRISATVLANLIPYRCEEDEYGPNDLAITKALWLRYIGLYKDPRYFNSVLEKWDEIYKTNIANISDPQQLMQCRFKQACLLAFQLPSKTDYHSNEDTGPKPLPTMKHELPIKSAIEFAKIWAEETSPDRLSMMDAIDSGMQQQMLFQEEKNTQGVLFTPADIDEACAKFCEEIAGEEKLNSDDQIKTQEELTADLLAMNAAYEKCIRLKPDELLKKLKSLKGAELKPWEQLLYLMEAEMRLTKKKLRLEQVLVVLHSIKNKALYESKTSEGKTTIIKFAAIVAALRGAKIDVLTHNEFLAKEGASEAQELAELCGLTVANADEKKSESADILYTEISRAIFSHMLGEVNAKPARKADLALVDEFDQIVLDMATTDMELSNPEDVSVVNHDFLIALAELINKQAQPAKTHEDFINRFQADLDALAVMKSEDLRFWVRAGIDASKLVANINYVLFADPMANSTHIQMVHHTTHGRRDDRAIWGRGVHQMVAALEIDRERNISKAKEEKHETSPIIIPPLTPAIAQENIINYLQTYPEIRGFTGTAGDTKAVTDFLRDALYDKEKEEKIFTPSLIRVQRAKRPHIAPEVWPRVPKKTALTKEGRTFEDTEALRHRAYHFPVQLCAGRDEHYTRLLEALRNVQSRNLSSMIFFDTIDECVKFHEYLLQNKMDPSNLQIYDDAGGENSGIKRLAEQVLINAANTKKKISICTAAAGRGINFKLVDAAFAAKPVMDRILQQELARVARDGALAVTHTIINQEDLGYARDWRRDNRTSEQILTDWMNEKQHQQLEVVKNKQQSANAKHHLQSYFFQKRNTVHDTQKKRALTNGWCRFLSEFDDKFNPNQPLEKQGELQKLWDTCFQPQSESSVIPKFLDALRSLKKV